MAQDLYGSFGSVPDLASGGGTTNQRLEVRATPDMFGAQVGEAMQQAGHVKQKVGEMITDKATKYAEVATQAKVNDDYANKYIPAAAELRNQYDQLQGQDKIHGYDGYMKGLQELNNQFVGGAKGQFEGQLWAGLTSRQMASEAEGAKRELLKSQIELSNQAATDKVMAEAGYAAANYNNPELVDGISKSIDSTIALQHIDNGLNPEHPADQEIIEEAQRTAKGDMAVGMIQSALSRGDAAAANQIRQKFGPMLPGYKQLAIDTTLHRENMRQIGVNGAEAFKNGQPLPPVHGAPPTHVQATVAKVAQTNGVDPNHALTVALIESNYGQNVGTRGDIGQTGKPAKNLEEQAQNMVVELKKSQDVARKALGREPNPWETYVCYQQGAGGGPALILASVQNPKDRAVDVLSKLYKNPKDALSAIIHNGGNATMTSGDFLSFLEKKYNDNAKRANCVMPLSQEAEQTTPEGTTFLTQKAPPSLADAIAAPHEQTGETVQPAATPRGALLNFDTKLPAMMERANAIPNLEVRQSVIENIKQQRSNLAISAAGYSSTLINEAQKLSVDPGFTSMNQVPSDLASALMDEHPETLNYLERSADRNAAKNGGGAIQDMKTYGPGMFNLMRDINEGKINSVTELMQHLPKSDGTGGDLTIAGFDKLKTLMVSDPESKSDTEMKTQAFKVIKRQLSGEDNDLGIKDPKGEELFSSALPKLYKALDDGKAKGLTIGEMTDPQNPAWIGNIVQGLKRSDTQMNMDMLEGTGETAEEKPERTFANIYKEYQASVEAGDFTKQEALKKEAEELGFVRKRSAVQAPISQ